MNVRRASGVALALSCSALGTMPACKSRAHRDVQDGGVAIADASAVSTMKLDVAVAKPGMVWIPAGTLRAGTPADTREESSGLASALVMIMRGQWATARLSSSRCRMPMPRSSSSGTSSRTPS